MIKFKHQNWELPISLSKDTVNIVQIECPNMFAKISKELYNQSLGEGSDFYLIDDNNKYLNLEKSTEIITDFIRFTCNNKKLITILYKRLEESLRDGEKQKLANSINTDLIEFINDICQDLDFKITYEDEFDCSSLLKMYDLKIDEDDLSLVEKLCRYIDLVVDLRKINIFFMFLIKSFLLESELIELYKYCRYKEISIVLFETGDFTKKIDGETVLVIDRDNCELVVK